MPNDTISVLPSWTWEVDITNGPGSATTTWTDITARVRGASWSRGRQSELGRDQPSTLRLDIDNRDRALDWFNGSATIPLRPMRRVRGRATWNSITYPLIYAYLDDPLQVYPGISDALLQVTAADGFKVLNKVLLSGDFPAQRSGARITALLDAAGWPAALRSIGTGVSLLDSLTLDRVSALEALAKTAETESGRFFVDASGNAKFVDRHTPYLTTSQATFGEQEIQYVDVGFISGGTLVFNEILAQRIGGELQSAVDATSQTNYLPSSRSHDALYSASDNEMADLTQFELALYKDYHPRIGSMILKGEAQPTLVWPQALGRELGDRWTVRKRPPGGGSMIEQESFIESLKFDVGVGTWQLSAGLSAIGISYQIYAAGKGIFTVGDATLGKIGSAGPGVMVY